MTIIPTLFSYFFTSCNIFNVFITCIIIMCQNTIASGIAIIGQLAFYAMVAVPRMGSFQLFHPLLVNNITMAFMMIVG